MARDLYFSIEVDQSAVDKLEHAVEAAISDGGLWQFMASKVRPWWEEHTVEVFASEGGTEGGTGLFGGWEALQPATQRIRESLGYEPDGPINVRDGGMFDAIQHSYDLEADGGGLTMSIPGHVDTLTEQKIEHAQRGSTNNPHPGFGPTPPRPVLNLTPVDAEVVLTALNRHLIESITGEIL